MALITVQTIIDDARAYADAEGDDSVSDTTFRRWVLNGCQKLVDVLTTSSTEVGALGSSIEYTTTSGVSTYALPDGFYKVRGVDVRYSSGSAWCDAEPSSFSQRNYYSSIDNQSVGWSFLRSFDTIAGPQPNVMFRVEPVARSTSGSLGEQLVVMPTPQGSHGLRLYYIQSPFNGEVPAAADNADFLNGFEEFVKLDVALKFLAKHTESEQYSILSQRLEMERQRITQAVPTRTNQNAPWTVTRIWKGRRSW